MVKHKVLKGFPYSRDGNETVWAEEGSAPDIREELVDGLVAAGYIEAPLAATTSDAIAEVTTVDVAEVAADEMPAAEPVDASTEQEPATDQKGRGGKKK